jgi:flagellar hook-basal body complex protein FliE
MSGLPDITVTPRQAARAYSSVELGTSDPGAAPGAGTTPDFGAVLGQALAGVVADGHAAETQAMAVVAGGGDLTSTVMALSKADLALTTTMAVRDKVVQAYQDIIKMPI